MNSDYIVECGVSWQDLAEGKVPPVCDGCNTPFWRDENGVYQVKALILVDGKEESIWGLVCDDTVRKYYSKLPVVKEKDAKPEVKGALLEVLGMEITVEAL